MAYHPLDEDAPKIMCREVAEWASVYLDQHMHDAEQIRIALHLAACAGCHAYLNQIDSVRQALKALPSGARKFEQQKRLQQAFAARRQSR